MRLVLVFLLMVTVGCSGSTKGAEPEPIRYTERSDILRVMNTATIPSTTTTTTTTTTTSTSTSTTTTTIYIPLSGQCGGDLPSCYIMHRESQGIITAQNPESSASGKWQILDSTWGGYGGYQHAKDAPEWVQDAKARSMALCNWEPPNYCA